MGTLSKGILGGFSGTVGPVIGGTWKGIPYMRSRPAKRSGKFSTEQLEQQMKFSIIVHFLQAVTGVIDVGFKNFANGMTAFNSAFSYNIKNGITGISPDFEVDYAKVLLSRGDLPNAIAPAATTTGSQVFFTWTDNSGMAKALGTDNSILVVYCKEMGASIFTYTGPQRSAASAQLDVSSFAHQTVETWIAFISEDGSEVSNSLYTGELVIA